MVGLFLPLRMNSPQDYAAGHPCPPPSYNISQLHLQLHTTKMTFYHNFCKYAKERKTQIAKDTTHAPI